jgi:radial spoke head protein 4A
MVSKADSGLLSKSQKFATPNMEHICEMLEWAGISFGEEEMYKLNKSVKRLAEMSGASSIDFKGKIYGTKKDYWVC